MELKYLWDTNVVAYFLQKNFNKAGEDFIDKIVGAHQPAISVITEIELLCWKTTSENDVILLRKFISDSVIFDLAEEIKQKTADIRKSSNIKLPDAIIAATAVVTNLTLISNDRGFGSISKLKLLNPFQL